MPFIIFLHFSIFLDQKPKLFLQKYNNSMNMNNQRGTGYQQSETHMTINAEMPPPAYCAHAEFMVPNPPPNPAPIVVVESSHDHCGSSDGFVSGCCVGITCCICCIIVLPIVFVLVFYRNRVYLV